MMMWRLAPCVALVAAHFATITLAVQITTGSVDSLKSAAASIVYNLLAVYNTNSSGTAPYLLGTLPQPLYWWHAGATWGAVLDYWAFTNDTSYNPSLTQALLTQAGPQADLMPQQFRSSMGNDDIAFWAFTALSAMEYGLPFPDSAITPLGLSSWLQLSQHVFDGMVNRWDTTSCGGGLKWQVYASNAGYDYKNADSNGGFFLIAARLARYTGNSTYYDWANKIWDWSQSINLVDLGDGYAVYDGSDDTLNCAQLDHLQWSYNSGLYLGGSAYLYNATKGNSTWGNRALGLLAHAEKTFFSPFPNATNVMYEADCELSPGQAGLEGQNSGGACNQDMLFFKAFLGRWLGKSAQLAPFLKEQIMPLLDATAAGAAIACSGFVPGAASSSSIIANLGINNTLCAQHFYGSPASIAQLSNAEYFTSLNIGQKVGQHLSALEVIQALIPLIDTRSTAQGGPRAIDTDSDVTIVAAPATTITVPTAAPSSTASSGPSTSRAHKVELSRHLGLLGLATTVLAVIR